MIRLRIKPSNSKGKAFLSYECGQMDKCGLCLAQKNLRALCNMLMKSWAILGFDGPIVCFRCNIHDKGYNYKFNTLFFGVWC